MNLETLEAIFATIQETCVKNLINKVDGPTKQVDRRQHHLQWNGNV